MCATFAAASKENLSKSGVSIYSCAGGGRPQRSSCPARAAEKISDTLGCSGSGVAQRIQQEISELPTVGHRRQTSRPTKSLIKVAGCCCRSKTSPTTLVRLSIVPRHPIASPDLAADHSPNSTVARRAARLHRQPNLRRIKRPFPCPFNAPATPRRTASTTCSSSGGHPAGL